MHNSLFNDVISYYQRGIYLLGETGDEMMCVKTQFQSDADFAEHKWFIVNISSFFHNFQCDAICGYSVLHTRFLKHTSILTKGFLKVISGEI